MKKLRLSILFCCLLFVTGCTNEDNLNATQIDEYEKQINELKKENEHLKDEFQKLSSDYSVYLQRADETSRSIMKLIKEKNFDQLKSEYDAEFEVSDGHLFFTKIDGFNPGFPIEQANFPMFVGYLNIQSEFIEIGYYLDDLKTDERYLITFSYDKDGEFNSIYGGDT